jgi:hypothetical protein
MPTERPRPRGPNRAPKMQWAAINVPRTIEAYECGPYRIYRHGSVCTFTVTIHIGAGLEMVIERGVPDLRAAKLKAKIHARAASIVW